MLHMVHQGVAPLALTSLVTHHFEDAEPGLTIQQLNDRLMNVAWPDYKEWIASRNEAVAPTSSKFSALRFSRDSWQSFPELTSHYKGAMVKFMIYWVASFLERFCNGTPMARLRAYTAYALARFQHLQDVNGPWLDASTADDMCDAGRSFLIFYQKLGLAAKMYKIVPKFHCMLHCALYVQRTHRNPRYEHLYQEEDFMKHISCICSQCHPKTMDTVCLYRYRALVELCDATELK